MDQTINYWIYWATYLTFGVKKLPRPGVSRTTESADNDRLILQEDEVNDMDWEGWLPFFLSILAKKKFEPFD